jgi:autotransporter-associated beta strand protein
MISSGKWSDGNPPSPANDYFTGAFFVRTPTDPTGSPAGLVYTFPGNSLTLQQPTGQGAPMRSILYKSGTSDVIIINNLTNATGGVLNNGGSGNVAAPTFTGNLWTIAGTSTILSDQGSTIVGYPLVCSDSSVILTNVSGQGRTITYTNSLAGFIGKFYINNNIIVELDAAAGFLGNPTIFTPDQISIGAGNNCTLLIHTPIQVTNPNGGINLTGPGQTVTFNIPNVTGTMISEPINDLTNGVSCNSRLAKSGGGILILSNNIVATGHPQNSWQGGTTVSSGTLQIGYPGSLPPNNVVVNGVLDLNGISTTISNLTGSGTVDTVAVSSTATLTLTGNGTFTGVIQNSGSSAVLSLTQVGPVTNTLSGGYTHGGQTLVGGGLLNLTTSGSVPATPGDLIVSNGAFLAVDATSGVSLPVNNLTLGTNTTLNLSLNAAANGINANGGLTLRDNAAINLIYGPNLNGNPTAIPLNAAGAISAPGANIVINVSGLGFKPGTITLIKYTGAALANLNNFSLIVPPGVVATLVNNMLNDSIDLSISSAPFRLSWNGVNGQNWDLSTINWSNTASATLTVYQGYTNGSQIGGDLVLFDDTLTNSTPQPTNINLTTVLYPGRITVGSTLPYSIGGLAGAGLAGAGALVKSNTASLTLLTSNTFTGGVFINDSGTVIITNDSALGANASVVTLNTGTLQVTANTTNNSRAFAVPADSFIDVVTNVTAQFGGGVNGAGNLTKIDAGTLAISGANRLTGALAVRQGSLNAVSGTQTLPAVVTIGDTGGFNASLNISGATFNPANNAAATTSGLIAGGASGAYGDIRLSSGTLQIARQLGLGAGAGAYGAMTISGGSAFLGNYLVVGFNNDQAVLNMTGGSVTVSNNFMTIGAGGSASTGVANIGSGTFTSAGGVYAGEFGNGTLNMSGGTMALGGGTAGLTIGVNALAIGTVNLNGGTVQTPLVTQGGGSGTLNFNGGVLQATASTASFITVLNNATLYNKGATLDDGGNVVTLSKPLVSPAGYGVATIPVSGGSGYIDTPIVQISGGSGSGATATATVSAGTVTTVVVTCPGSGYQPSDTLTVSFFGGGATATPPTVGTITFAQNGTGGLTKQGNGTLTLTGVNTFTGPITNKAGTLFLNSPSTYVGAVAVNSGTLEITPATVFNGTNTIANGATFTVFQSGNSTTTISNLTLNGSGALPGARIGLSINPANNSAVPLLNCGTLTLSGTNTIALAGSLQLGTIKLIKALGAVAGTGNITNLSLPQGDAGTISSSFDGTFTTISANITTVGPGLVWTGTNITASTNVWDINSTINWVLGTSPTTYQQTIIPGDAVTFNDVGSGVVNLNALVSPSSVLISNNVTPYAIAGISGSAGISGPTGLLKQGSGTASLSQNLTNFNNYTGNTTISNGTLVVTNAGAGSALSPLASLVIGPNGTLNLAAALANAITPVNEFTGSGVVHYRGGINSILSFGGSTGGTWNGTIRDDGGGGLSLTKNGTGTWVIGGTNHLNNGDFFNGISQAQFNGGTTIITNGGAVTVASTECWVAQGVGSTSTVVVAGGTLSVLANNLTIGRGAANANGTLIVNSGTVQKAGAGNLIVGGSGNANGTTQAGPLAGSGTLIVNGGQVLNSSALYLGQNTGANAALYLNGGLLQAAVVEPNGTPPTSSTAYFNGGILQASANSDNFLQVTANVMSNGLVLDDGGFTLTNSFPLLAGDGFGGGVVKQGAGAVYLDGNNGYTGLTVVSNGFLAGIGNIPGGVLVAPGGTIGAGDAGASVGLPFGINNSLTIHGAASFRVSKNASVLSSDLISGLTTANYGGTLFVSDVTSDGTPLAPGDTFTLFSATTHNGNFSSIVNTSPDGASYTFANGILTVASINPSTNPTNITFRVSGNGKTLTISWPADHLGWYLQSNSVSLPARVWFDIPGSQSGTSMDIPINPAQPLTYFRLRYP